MDPVNRGDEEINQKQNTVLLVATMDTKGKEAEFMKEEAEKNYLKVMLMDVGIRKPIFSPDISNEEVMSHAGYKPDEILEKGRPFCVEVMQEGGLVIAKRLIQEKRIHGIIGIGGGTGTSIATYIMRGLPYGFPKVMVSTVASRNVREYVGVKDILMFHTVADLLGFNSFTRFILTKAVLAMSKMVEGPIQFLPDKPLVALTAYGINSQCAVHIEPLLAKRGYELICFHANGTGGIAMEDMAREGLIKGILDLTLHEIADDLFGGYCNCKGMGVKRLEIECASGVPLVLSPGGLDNAVFSPHYPMPSQLSGRKIHHHDVRFCVRMEKEEMELFAEIIAKKVNNGIGPIKILIPKKGFSEIDVEGQDFFDMEILQVFAFQLKKRLRNDIEVEEVEANISEKIFAEKAVESLFSMMHSYSTFK